MEQESSSAEQFKDQGNEQFKQKNFLKAIEFYTKAINLDSQASYFGNRGLCYMQMEKYQKCIEDCNQALNIDPNFSKVLRRRAKSNIFCNNIDQAERDYLRCIELEPKDRTLQNDLQDCRQKNLEYIESSMAAGKYSDAITFINNLLTRYNQWHKIQFLQVECLAYMGKTDKAKQVLLDLQNTCSQQDPNFIYSHALVQLYQGNSEKAKTYFESLMRQDPDNKRCQVILRKVKNIENLKEKGNQLLKEQKYDESIQAYTEALQIDPFNKKLNAIIYSNKALAYMKIKKYEEAQEECNHSIQNDESYYKSYLRRGKIREELEDFDAAIFDYKKVQELDSSRLLIVGQNMRDTIRQCQVRAKQAKKKDYYKILDVSRDADPSTIKKAYRKQALLFHPDKNKGKSEEEQKKCELKFKDVNEAYSVLSDEKKKHMYDNGQDPEGNGGMDYGNSFDPSSVFSMFFGGGMGGGMGGGRGGGGFGGGRDDFDSFFQGGQSSQHFKF